MQRRQFLLFGGIFAGLIGLLAAGYFAFLRPGYAVLYQDLREADSAAIVAQLEKDGIPYRLAENHYLRRFVEGLTHLVRDEFEDAIAEMETGIGLNEENDPLNNDIRLLLVECRKLAAESAGGKAGDDGDLSATSLLLGQFIPGSRH